MFSNRSIFVLVILAAITGLLLLVGCRGGDNSAAELARLEKEISDIEADVGAITKIKCPLPITGEVE